ncbi:response regulator [Bittarella massiliensis (ex Durand et al. 2017)]|uniref:response regulator n=1 Tax=Bittarella massiliensis (ex Durand et al. 2017) TaxID=1720313 RepID=UPI001AA1BB9B|nr:response regulator [Bittarella massiliensis (ex Durand et al. 2017)]MBO1678514.1 response regulator [Bittarella massiliensis (ex Durand et al. 2017)]
MAEQSVISMDQMKEILDNAPVAVFVCSIKDQGLLYRNSLAKKLFPGDKCSGATCYHMAGFEEPCPFCRMGEMRQDGFVTREYSPSGSGRTYQLSGKLIDWAGETAHIEYILDITEKKQEAEQHRKSEEALFEAHERVRETQQELNHLVNSIPGGIATYQIEEGRYSLTYMSDGVPALTGYTREEYEERARQGIFDNIYEPDRNRVVRISQAFIESGEVLDVSYRVRHKDGSLVWIHLNGRCISSTRFYAAFTGMSAESRLFQSIANETADGIYVIDKENYELLYANESKSLFAGGKPCIGQTCYTALQGKDAPCDFCALNRYGADGEEHEIRVDDSGRVYSSRFRETDWNGIPAHIQYIRDVTDEVRTRREKERLELYFQSILEALPSGVCVMATRPDGSMFPEYISEGFAAMTLMTLEESYALYRRNVFGGVHPDDIESNWAKVQACLDRGEDHFEIEARFLCGDGSYIWVKDHVSVQTGVDGIQRLYSVYTDISETVKENERVNRQYEDLILEHYHTPGADELLLGHCNITQGQIIQVKDFTGTNCFEALGKDREGFFTRLAGFIVDEKERQTFLDTYLRAPALAAFERDETEKVQICFVKLPGQSAGRYIQIKVNMIAAPGTDDVIGVLTVTDVTDKTMTDRILQKLSVTTHDYILDANLLADTFKMLNSNQNAYLVPEAAGCYSERVAYMAENIVLEKDRARYAEALRADMVLQRLKDEDSYTITYSLSDENGGVRTKNMTMFSLDLQLGRVGLVCTDITDSVRTLEDALLSAQQANRAKSDFLSRMSHEIRTPLNAIIGMMAIAGAHIDEPVRVEDCLTKAVFSAKHLLMIINDVLDMSKIDSNKMVLQNEPFDIFEVVNGYVSTVFAQAKAKQIEFSETMEGFGEHTTFVGDSLRLNQILLNLSSNAVKFTPPGGKVHLTVSHLASKNKTDILRFALSDTGIGMTEEAIGRIFQPFEQADASIAGRFGGTGLGMSITGNLVALLGGIIQVESELGKGSTFTVDLPFQKSDENIQEPDFANLGLSALIVDDEQQVCEQTASLLEKIKIQAEWRLSGNHALERLSALRRAGTPFDLCFIDWKMPDMDGVELTRRIRREIGEDIPIVLISAYDISEIEDEARAAGVNGFLPKPLYRSSVYSAVQSTVLKKSDSAAPVPEDAKKVLEGKSLLVAEDNEINQEVARMLLEDQGARVLCVDDGQKALDTFLASKSGEYDAILMDVQMPVMNGHQAAQQIRTSSHPDAMRIPIIAVTANAFSDDISAALAAGMNAHVSKPLNVEQLCQALAEQIGKTKQREEK